MRLSELKEHQKAIVVKVGGQSAFRKRISEMGFVKGKEVEVIKNAPLKDPAEYKIMGYEVSLRKNEAQLIEVQSISSINNFRQIEVTGTLQFSPRKKKTEQKTKDISIALVGNPNSGKTTFFNFASGAQERVGNYGGVTVSVKKGNYKHKGYTFNISDLPGTYSLSAITPDELFVINHLVNEKPDVVINVVDASNLERNLYLTTLLLEMDIKVVVALNMYDEMIARGFRLDHNTLSEMLGAPIIPTVSTKGKRIDKVFEKIIDLYEEKKDAMESISVNYGKIIENSILKIQQHIDDNIVSQIALSKRTFAIKLLEKDPFTYNFFIKNNQAHTLEASESEINKIETQFSDNSDTVITDMRYGFISGALKKTYLPSAEKRRYNTEIIDTFLTHKLFGFPIFFALMYFIFYITFKAGDYPMQWIENLTGIVSSFISNAMAEGMLRDLLVDGIIAGIGGVIVFLPNIMILFFFISLMEDTGYMARAVFIMDKVMRKMGLHGKSFIPLMMGFGCNVPAIMSSRILNSKSDRLITILVNPFMSCSARLPIYLLIIGTFFIAHAPLVLFGIYSFGVVIAIVFARIFRKYIFPHKEVPFVLELPPYRMPTFKSTLLHMWSKAVQYLKKIAGVILIASIIIWALGYFPLDVNYSKDYDAIIAQKETSTVLSTDQKAKEIALLQDLKQEERQSKTYISRIGKAVAPMMSPLGFDWKMSVSVITGLAAKEVVVSTMGVLFQEGTETTAESVSLREKIRNQGFSPAVAIAFLIFVLIYFPCISVIVTIAKETNWKWAAFTAIYTTVLAWVLAFIIYQFLSLF